MATNMVISTLMGTQYANTLSAASTGHHLDRLDFRSQHQHDSAVDSARDFYDKVLQNATFSDPHLPNCIAHKNVSFYEIRLMLSKRNRASVTQLISTLDPQQRIAYWKSWQTQLTDGECPAAKLWGGPEPPRSNKYCNITNKDVQEALHRKIQALCPGFDYNDMAGSNTRCKQHIENSVRVRSAGTTLRAALLRTALLQLAVVALAAFM
jgi:hypothetical protein